LQDREVLERLLSDAFGRIDHQEQEFHACRAGEHVVQEALVPRHVHDAGFDSIGKCKCAKPRSSVMPRTRSSSKRSGFVPVNAATSADFP